ncbi:hypothetical protein NW837_09115, partial [Synechococcus sp. R6-10]
MEVTKTGGIRRLPVSMGRWLGMGSLIFGLLLGLSGCVSGMGSGGSREEVAILLASFAVTRDAYRKIV